jgi:hypothetical protein
MGSRSPAGRAAAAAHSAISLMQGCAAAQAYAQAVQGSVHVQVLAGVLVQLGALIRGSFAGQR